MTMIPGSDAVRAMTVFAISAGFGRLVGYWAAMPCGVRDRVVVVDVPADSLQKFYDLIVKQTKATADNLEKGLKWWHCCDAK